MELWLTCHGPAIRTAAGLAPAAASNVLTGVRFWLRDLQDRRRRVLFPHMLKLNAA